MLRERRTDATNIFDHHPAAIAIKREIDALRVPESAIERAYLDAAPAAVVRYLNAHPQTGMTRCPCDCDCTEWTDGQLCQMCQDGRHFHDEESR